MHLQQKILDVMIQFKNIKRDIDSNLEIPGSDMEFVK